MSTIKCNSVTADNFLFRVGPVGGHVVEEGVPNSFEILPPGPQAEHARWRIDQIDVIASWAIDDILIHYESVSGERSRVIIGKNGPTGEPGGKGKTGGTLRFTAGEDIWGMHGFIGSEGKSEKGYQPKQSILKIGFTTNHAAKEYGGGSPNPVASKFDFPNIEWGMTDTEDRLGFKIVGLYGTFDTEDSGHTSQTILSLGAIYSPVVRNRFRKELDAVATS